MEKLERIDVNDETGEINTLTKQRCDQNVNVMQYDKINDALLKSQLPKTEEDKTWKEIKNMSDEELDRAIEDTTIEEGDKLAPASENTSEMESPLKSAIDGLAPEEIARLISVSMKAIGDPDYNVVPEIPKEIFSMIQGMCKMRGIGTKGTSRIAREMIIQLGNELSSEALDKDFKDVLDMFNDTTSLTFAAPMAFQANAAREEYEIKMGKLAEDESLPEDKRKVFKASSEAFKDSYTLRRQLELLNDDNIVIKMEKFYKEKRFIRMCDDFDFVVNKVIPNQVKITELIPLLPHIVKIGEANIRLFIILTCLACKKNMTKDDTAEILFMYSSIYNIKSLAASNNLVENSLAKDEDSVKFIKERINYVKEFFSTLDAKLKKIAHV